MTKNINYDVINHKLLSLVTSNTLPNEVDNGGVNDRGAIKTYLKTRLHYVTHDYVIC